MSDQSKQYDSFGVLIEVGDIIFSAPKGGKGHIARVEKIFPSGHVTIKWPHKVDIYAYERGAPKIPRKGTRVKVGEDGMYVREEPRLGYGGGYRPYVYEEYEYEADDYTTVGHRWKWVKTECAWYARVILWKKDGTHLSAFSDGVTLDYNAEVPDLEV